MRILVSRRDNFNYIITSEGLLLLNLTIAHLEWTKLRGGGGEVPQFGGSFHLERSFLSPLWKCSRELGMSTWNAGGTVARGRFEI